MISGILHLQKLNNVVLDYLFCTTVGKPMDKHLIFNYRDQPLHVLCGPNPALICNY